MKIFYVIESSKAYVWQVSDLPSKKATWTIFLNHALLFPSPEKAFRCKDSLGHHGSVVVAVRVKEERSL